MFVSIYEYINSKLEDDVLKYFKNYEEVVVKNPIEMIQKHGYSVFLLMNVEQRKIFFNWARKIVLEYADIVEKYSFPEDVSVLPYKKKEIETAFYIHLLVS
jgi:hypothetical protein